MITNFFSKSFAGSTALTSNVLDDISDADEAITDGNFESEVKNKFK
jgi:hypothetical protein